MLQRTRTQRLPGPGYRRKTLPAGKGGWIYAVSKVGAPLVKVGSTIKGMDHRLPRLQYRYHVPLVLLAVVPVPYDVKRHEHYVHNLLAGCARGHEWFYTHMNQRILERLVIQACDRYRETCTGFSRKEDRACWACPTVTIIRLRLD